MPHLVLRLLAVQLLSTWVYVTFKYSLYIKQQPYGNVLQNEYAICMHLNIIQHGTGACVHWYSKLLLHTHAWEHKYAISCTMDVGSTTVIHKGKRYI